MRWLLTSWGSYGDLHPFLALGRGLIARGHQVTLVGNPDWTEETEAAGLRFVSTGEPSRKDFIKENPDVLSTKWAGLVSLHTLVSGAIAPCLDQVMTALMKEAGSHDVMVAHHFVFSAPAAAELEGIPLATVVLAPGVTPSDHSLPGSNFGRIGRGILVRIRNIIIWRVGRRISQIMVDPVINRFRKRHGLKRARDVVFEDHSRILNLHLFSEHFAPRQLDWSAEKRVAGFCFYDPSNEKSLSPEIEEFLGQGEAPVLFTLGSAAVQNPGAFYESAVEALETLGLRGVLLIGPERNRPARLPKTVLAVSYAPYGLLMPRMRAVVHQCGAGTLSHALRAGLPSVACPFAFDQPNNARRLEDIGVAEVLLPHQHTARQMSDALRQLLSSDASTKAQSLGELIRAEDGVGRTCAILEETFTNLPRRTSPFS